MSNLSIFAKDARERAVNTLWQTFAGAFLTTLGGSTFVDDLARLQWNESALVAAVAAGLAALGSVVKAFIAKNKPNTVSPASFATARDVV